MLYFTLNHENILTGYGSNAEIGNFAIYMFKSTHLQTKAYLLSIYIISIHLCVYDVLRKISIILADEICRWQIPD